MPSAAITPPRAVPGLMAPHPVSPTACAVAVPSVPTPLLPPRPELLASRPSSQQGVPVLRRCLQSPRQWGGAPGRTEEGFAEAAGASASPEATLRTTPTIYDDNYPSRPFRVATIPDTTSSAGLAAENPPMKDPHRQLTPYQIVTTRYSDTLLLYTLHSHQCRKDCQRNS